MIKSRIYLSLVIIVCAVALYMLPRYVVNNTDKDIDVQNNPEASEGNKVDDSHNALNHNFQIPDSVMANLERFYESYKNAVNQEKRFIFADSLAKTYKTVGKLDSSAKYSEVRAIENPGIENFIIAGDGYFEAFNFTTDQNRSQFLAKKARDYYSRVLEENPGLLDIKSKVAMTYVVGSNPMQGIIMLQEVLKEDPNNEMAIYNLGILSVTSGQYEKAVERFQALEKLNPENPEANFYLGYCLFELGKKEEAKAYFLKVTKLGINGDLVLASEEYLKRIN